MKLKTLAEKYHYICYWCKKKHPLEDLSRDHIEPVRRGRFGMTGGGTGNAKELVLACISCNADRGNTPFFHYQQELEKRNAHRTRNTNIYH